MRLLEILSNTVTGCFIVRISTRSLLDKMHAARVLDWRWGNKSTNLESVANKPWNYFWRIPTYVIIIHQRHRRMDRQTDG